MAAATGYAPTTSGVGLNKLWRKVQGKLQTGLNFVSEEWSSLKDLKNFDIDWSAREITVPIDILEGTGVASIPEGGWEARPSSPNVEEITLSWVLFNKRFTATKTAMFIDKHNPGAELKKQLVYQGMKAVQAMGRHVSDYFYGYGTAVLARTSTGATQASGVYTLDQGYDSTITNFAYITDKFKVGDYVALIRGGVLVTNAIGVVTAVTAATPSITVTWNGSVDSDANDLVVKANSLENTTIAGTDYNGGLTGLLDMLKTASVHNLSSGSVANWSVAMADTTGGRLSGVRIHKGKDEIANYGGGKGKTLYMSQGVYRDLIAQMQGALRFSDPMSLELDGEVKSKGLTFFKSRRVPPGYAIMAADNTLHRMTLLPNPDGENPTWADGDKLQDQSGFVFSLDWPMQLIVTNRKNLAYWSGLTEQ